MRISELRNQFLILHNRRKPRSDRGGDPLDRRLGETEEREELGVRPGMRVLLVRLEGQTMERNEVWVLSVSAYRLIVLDAGVDEVAGCLLWHISPDSTVS